MLLVLSHVLTFSALFVASLFDIDSTDVPDVFAIVAIVGGILLHAMASLDSLSFSKLISALPGLYSWMTGGFLVGSPVDILTGFLSGLGEPLAYSLVTGTILFAYGWLAYMRGMWGGADALGIAALGFGAPFVPPQPAFLEPLNLFVNVMLAGFVYILGFSLFRGLTGLDDLSGFRERLVEDRRRILLESAGAVVLAGVIGFSGGNWLAVAAFFLPMVFIVRFLRTVQDEILFEEKPVNEVSPGEVAAPGQGFGDEIRGLEEDEIESFDGDVIEVRRGVPFMPVFVFALLMSDLMRLGVLFLVGLF